MEKKTLEAGEYAEVTFLIVVSCIGFIGNISLWQIITRHSELRSTSNALVLCLSTADILVSSINVPVIIVTLIRKNWRPDDDACILLGFLNMTTFVGSVMFLAVISLNRYILVCHIGAFKRLFTKRKIVLIISGK